MANPLYDDLFGCHARNEAPFLILADGTIQSFQTFVAQAAQFAHLLVARGLEPGDRVAIQVEKSPQALALIAGCIQAGIVFLPLNTGYTSEELRYFVSDSGARLLICGKQAAEQLGDLAVDVAIFDVSSEVVEGAAELPDDARSFCQTLSQQPVTFQTVARSKQDLAALLYTSGTTGRSKGAMLSQENLLSNARSLVSLWQFGKEDVLLHALPIYHLHGLFVATNVMLLAGGKMIFLPKFDLDQVIGFLPQATSLMGVPTFYTRLLQDDRFDADLTADMRLFISGSAPLLAETHHAFEARTGHRILERYGMTETGMNTSNPYQGERRPGTVGFALPEVELRICDAETGAALPQDEIGVIEVRGPNVFQGYWQMPEKTAAELRPDGYFITGDLGKIDADGYVHILGRNKDLIISGGFNIYPKEIEQLLDAQPGVLESAVIAAPHADFGESPVAVLVAKPGEALDFEAISQAIAGQLARFKHPKHMVCLDALPRNTMGKVQKNLLRDQFKDVFL